MKENAKGHLLALFTICVWGTTFIATKVLLKAFTPIEILFMRFLIGYFLLLLMHRQGLSVSNKKQELYFIGAGLTGVTFYFLLENIALTYTYASNVGIIIATAPFFTAILGRMFLKEEKLKTGFFVGFLTSITGIILISIHGSSAFSLNPKGDILAFLAAFVWACYSVLVKKIGSFGISTIQSTRHIFFYGILFMIIPVFLMGFEWKLERFSNPIYLGNMLFLGVGASALCFVTWNLAVKLLGAVRTAVYLYLSPVVTILASAIILGEKITVISVIGAGLVFAGLLLSDKGKGKN
ncbi:DMT family transporter [Lachnospiraceae bacterium AM25-11LB]|nr:DMT family transporter [Lachnospiraceae bacterium AM25-22]RGD09201.1 DMT family transporter [Lachnospiraceae bacterium AM25-11LB]RJW13428.1 DMT family transporter [Lachnospiraceae bacterium AM25-40]RJW18140.1 DMT family transporter [Lachnospiraceae bacterium AM25-39]